MRSFIGFIKKEFLHILRDPLTLMIIVLIPIIELVLFGYVLSNDLKNEKIAILDHSKDEVTLNICNKITSSGYFEIEKKLQSEKQILAEFKKGKVKAVIVFENDFSKKLYAEKKANIQLILDAGDPNLANMTQYYLSSIIRNYLNSFNKGFGINIITPEVNMKYNPELKSVYMFVPGLFAFILMLICALITSVSITREKELGTMEILLASPLPPYQIIVGKIIPYILISFINMSLILAISYFVFQVPIVGSMVLLLAEGLLFICLALSVGILISTIAKAQQVAMMISLVGLMLPTMLLSGFIYPISNMPKIIQYFTLLIPARWFLVILKAIMLKGAGLEMIWKETLIIFGMTLLFILISVKKFKLRLE